MTTKQQEKHSKDQEKQERLQLSAVLSQQVMHGLGQPADLLRVQVRWLWDHYYRVNVFVGLDVSAARIDSSFFLEADGEGKIVEATPPIARKY